MIIMRQLQFRQHWQYDNEFVQSYADGLPLLLHLVPIIKLQPINACRYNAAVYPVSVQEIALEIPFSVFFVSIFYFSLSLAWY